jgi:hypothetical protein
MSLNSIWNLKFLKKKCEQNKKDFSAKVSSRHKSISE